jgi:hypothetical protein
MKVYLALAGALALSACDNNGADAAPSGSDQATVTATPPPANLTGTYGANGVDGQPWTSSLNADGTYQNTIAGQVSEVGKWSHTDNRLCFEPDAADGQPAPEATCLTLVETAPNGSLVLADEAGNQTTAPRIDEQS